MSFLKQIQSVRKHFISLLSDIWAGGVPRIVAEQDKTRDAEQKLNQALE